MKTPRRFEYLDRSNLNQFEQFFSIYTDSIERSEQKPKEKIRELSQRPDYLIRLLYESENLVGFTLSYKSAQKGFALLEYMAVEKTARSHGYGSLLLKDLVSSLSKLETSWLLLEVDSPYQQTSNQDERIRRVQFYRRNGCAEIENFDYILPLPTAPEDLEMKLMVFDVFHRGVVTIAATELMEFVRDVYVNVYQCDRSDSRLAKMFSNLPQSLNLKK